MSERKVLNKYFPPDFDPSLIKRRKLGADRQQAVRLMAPFSMRCSKCGEYIYKGKKFNARKETAQGEEYYGVKIFRFYIKCTHCSAEITFKTDPKNADYVAEHGAMRNFEPWRENKASAENDKDRLDELEEEANNPMAALEVKTVDAKREMEILDALQELKSRNARIERAGKEDPTKFIDRVSANVDTTAGGADDHYHEASKILSAQQRLEEEQDEAEIRRVFGRAHLDGVPDIELDAGGGNSSEDGSEAVTSEPASPRPRPATASTSAAAASVKRKLDAVEPSAAALLSEASKAILAKNAMPAPPPKKKGKSNNALANKLGIKLKGK